MTPADDAPHFDGGEPLNLPAPAVYTSPEPFSPRYDVATAPHGATMAAIITHAVNEGRLAIDDVPLLRVYLNGEEVPRHLVLDTVVHQGDLVNLVVAPQGGNTGRAIFQILYTIGAAVVGFFFGPVWGAAVTVAGMVATSLIWQPQKPDSLESNPGGALSDSSNSYRRRGMMPLALGGGRRVAPDVCALAYTQNVGNDVWLHVGFAWHYGPVQLTGIKIGETRLEDYPATDIQVEHFLTPGPRNSQIYPNRVVQENLQDELELGGAAEVHTTSEDCDRIELDFTWPEGLNFNKDNGKILPQETQLLVEWAPAGSGAWQPAPIPPYQSRTGGSLPPGSVYVQARSRDPVRHTVGWDVPGAGQFDVRVSAWDPDNDEVDRATQRVYWTALRTMRKGLPVLDEQLAVTFLKIKSSDDLNGTLPTITGIPTPICPVWTGAGWGSPQPTSNAAALAHWLVTGPCQAQPWPSSAVDDSFGQAYALIEQFNWHGAFYVQDDITLEDALLALGRMGRFGIYWNGEALCAVPDWEKPFARQMFSGRNVESYRYRREFPGPVHAVFVEFQNLDEDSRGDELWVYNDGYDAANTVLFETLRIDFACTADRAYREGRVYLAKRALQVEIHEFTTGVDAIVSTYGDRIRVRHATALFGAHEARCVFRRMAGGLVSAIRLDDPFMVEAGKSYVMDVRRADQLLLGITVSFAGAGLQSEVLLTPALPEGQAPGPDDLVVIGEPQVTTEDLEIIDIEPGDNYTATIRAQRYLAVEIEQAETGPIPPLNPNLKPRQGAPRPRIIGVRGDPDGVVVAFEVDPTRANLVQGFTFRWRRSPMAGATVEQSDWQPLPNLPATARQGTTPPIADAQAPGADPEAEYRVDLELRTVMLNGDVSAPATALNVLVTRKLLPPSNFQASGVVRTAPDNSKYPALYVQADPIDGGPIQDLEVELRVSIPPGPWVTAGAPLPSSNPKGDFLGVDPGQTYDVRGRWRSADNYHSAWVQVDDVLIPPNSRISYAAQTVGGYTPEQFQEVLNNASIVGSKLTGQVRDLAQGLLQNTLRLQEEKDYTDLLGHLDGVKLPVVVAREKLERISDKEVMGRTFDLLGAVMGDYSAFALNELTVLVRPGESLSTWRTRLEAADAANTALFMQEAEARTTADETFARWFNFLGAERGDQTGWNLAESTVILSNGQSLSTYRTQTAASIGNVQSAVTTETQARISGDQALASQIQQVAVQANGWQGSVTTLQQVVSQIGAEYTLALNVNGHVSGMRQYNNGYRSSFIVSATEIGFSNGPSTVYPLAIIGGIVRAQNFEVDHVTAGSIVAESVVADNINQSYRGSMGGSVTLPDGSDQLLVTVPINVPNVAGRGGCRVVIYSLVRISNAGGISTAQVRHRVNGNELAGYAQFCDGAWGDNFAVFESDAWFPAGPHTITVTCQRNYSGGGPLTATQASCRVEIRKTET